MKNYFMMSASLIVASLLDSHAIAATPINLITNDVTFEDTSLQTEGATTSTQFKIPFPNASIRAIATVSNPTGETLLLTKFFNGADPLDFTVVDEAPEGASLPACGINVPPGDTCDVYVSFTPKKIGKRSEVVILCATYESGKYWSLCDAAEATVTLDGTGTK